MNTTNSSYQNALNNYMTCIYGHKKWLLKPIHKAIPANARSFIDLFSGTGVVGWSVKHQMRLKIISNDIMRYACLRAIALIQNNSTYLTQKDMDVLTEDNPSREHYIERYYGRFLGEENAVNMDNWAANIPKLDDPMKMHIATFIPTYCIMKKNIYCSVTMSPTGTLTGYRNYWDENLIADCMDYALNMYPSFICNNEQKNEVYHVDSVGLVPELKADVLYIDSPYCARGGAYEHHLSFYDDLVQIFSGRGKEIVNHLDHKADLPEYTHFQTRSSALVGFTTLFRDSCHIPTLILSYNTTSNVHPDELVALSQTYGRKTTIQFIPYQRPTTQKGKNTKTEEVIMVGSY